MKKTIKLLSLAMVLSSGVMAQVSKTIPPPPIDNEASRPRKPRIIRLPDLLKTTVTVVGTTDAGVVLETQTGEKLLLNADNTITPLENKRWTPILRRTQQPAVFKLIGSTDKGAPVWAGPDGTGGCTLDSKGVKVDYVGHVTLLR
jgi:hypothetical protein